MRLKAWDYLVLTTGSAVIWLTVNRLAGHLLAIGTPPAEEISIIAPSQRAMSGRSRTTTVPESPPRPAFPLSTTTAKQQDVRVKLKELAAENLCPGSSKEERAACAEAFISAATAAGIGGPLIGQYAVDELMATDPELALHIMRIVMAPMELNHQQDAILKEMAAKDPLRAMKLVLELPPGGHFEMGLHSLARALPLDGTLAGNIQSMMVLLADEGDRQLLDQEFSGLLQSAATPLPREVLEEIARASAAGELVKEMAIVKLWRDGGSASPDKARHLKSLNGGSLSFGIAHEISEMLLAGGTPAREVMALAEGGDASMAHGIISPLMGNGRLSFTDLSSIGNLMVDHDPGDTVILGILSLSAEEAMRFHPARDPELVSAFPHHLQDTMRVSMIRSSARADNFPRALTMAEGIREEALRVTMKRELEAKMRK